MGTRASKEVVVDIYVYLSTDVYVGVFALAIAEEVEGMDHRAVCRIFKGYNTASCS